MAKISSAASATASVTPVLLGAWLKDPLDPAGNVEVELGDNALELTSVEQQGVFRGLGRAEPVVLTGAIGLESGKLGLVLLPAARAKVEALRARQRTLLLQTPFGDHLYLRLGPDRVRTRLFGFASKVERWRADFFEVRRP